MSGSHDSERMYIVLDRIEGKVDRVGERLAVVETLAHKPDDCPGSKRLDERLSAHIEDDKEAAKEAFWRGWGKEFLKLLAAMTAGFIGSRS